MTPDVEMIIAVYEFIIPTTLSSGQNLYRIPSSLYIHHSSLREEEEP